MLLFHSIAALPGGTMVNTHTHTHKLQLLQPIRKPLESNLILEHIFSISFGVTFGEKLMK